MKILFDQGVPVPLRASLRGHDVLTAHEKGWGNLAIGDLLRAAETEGFDVIVTTDQNLGYQQNLPARRVAVVVFMTTSRPRMRPKAPELAMAITAAVPGSYSEVLP